MKPNSRSTNRLMLCLTVLGLSSSLGLAGCANGPRDMFSKMFHRNDAGAEVAVLPEEGERLVNSEEIVSPEVDNSSVVTANDPSFEEELEVEEPAPKIGLGKRIKGWFKRDKSSEEEVTAQKADDEFLTDEDFDSIFEEVEQESKKLAAAADELDSNVEAAAEALNEFDASEALADATDTINAEKEKFNASFDDKMAEIDEMMKLEEEKRLAEEQQLMESLAAMEALAAEEDAEEMAEEAEEEAEELAELLNQTRSEEFASTDVNPFETAALDEENFEAEAATEEVNPFEQLSETTRDAVETTTADTEKPGIIRFDLSEGFSQESQEEFAVEEEVAEEESGQVLAKELFEEAEEESSEMLDPAFSIPQAEEVAEVEEEAAEMVAFISSSNPVEAGPVIEEMVEEEVAEEEPVDEHAALSAFGLTEKGNQVPVFDWSNDVEATSTQTAVTLQEIETSEAQVLENIPEFSDTPATGEAALTAKETQKTLRWVGVAFAIFTIVLLLRRKRVA